MKVVQPCLTLCDPSPWNSPGQNTGVGDRSPLRGIFPTQGSNPDLPLLWNLKHSANQILSLFSSSPRPPPTEMITVIFVLKSCWMWLLFYSLQNCNEKFLRNIFSMWRFIFYFQRLTVEKSSTLSLLIYPFNRMCSQHDLPRTRCHSFNRPKPGNV